MLSIAMAGLFLRPGNLQTYTSQVAGVETSLLAKRVEKLNLEQSILEQQVALRAVVGSALPETPNPEGSAR